MRRDNDRLEEYRVELKSCLNDILGKVDKIIDYCYTDHVSNIDITISLNPDIEIPTVTYVTKTLNSRGYETVFHPEKEK